MCFTYSISPPFITAWPRLGHTGQPIHRLGSISEVSSMSVAETGKLFTQQSCVLVIRDSVRLHFQPLMHFNELCGWVLLNGLWVKVLSVTSMPDLEWPSPIFPPTFASLRQIITVALESLLELVKPEYWRSLDSWTTLRREHPSVILDCYCEWAILRFGFCLLQRLVVP